MTLAVGAVFPWGQLRRIADSVPGGGFITGGVVLLSDSRWTFPNGSVKDAGQKLWPLAPHRNVGAVYAGDVHAAEDSLTLAAKRLEPLSSTEPNGVADVVQVALCETYSAHAGRRSDLGPLYVLVGMANRLGEGLLIRFAYSTNFSPIFVAGIDMIGWPTASEKLRNRLPDIDRDLMPRDGKSWPLDIKVWALHLAAYTFDEVIAPGTEPTVGGAIQIATLTPNGWEDLEIAHTSDLTGKEGWEGVTKRRNELQQWTAGIGAPDDGRGLAAFGFTSVLDESCLSRAVDAPLMR